jgi:hypothetical protein
MAPALIQSPGKILDDDRQLFKKPDMLDSPQGASGNGDYEQAHK